MKNILLIISSLFVFHTAHAQYGKCFAPQLLHGTSGTALQIVSADFNNDNNADAVITNFTTNNIDVQLNAFASGNFSPASYTTSAGPTTSALGDIDNDGDVDIVVAGNSTNINILKNNGFGTFTTYTTNTTTYSNFAHSILADMNNDGNLDLVLSAQSGAIVTMLGNGAGNFTTNTTKTLGGSGGRIVVYDFNADGKKDIVVVESSVNKIEQILGNGTGGFLASTYTTTVGFMPQDIICADLNYDGVNDVAVGNYNSNNMSVLYTNSGGALPTVNTTVTFPSNYFPQALATGDFNNDAKADIVIGFNVSGKIGVLLNDASGSFQAPIYFTPTATPRGIVVGKFDAGTNLDFACVYQSSSQMQSWLNNLAPNVGISATSYTLCIGQPVTLNGTGANTYTWANGIVNNSAFTPTLTTTYSVTGTSTVTGCASTATLSVPVVPTVSLTLTSTSTLVCGAQTATLTANGATTYQWAHTSSTSSVMVVGAGNWQVGANTACGYQSQSIFVQGSPNPTINITASNTTICSPGSVTLTANGASTYNWTWGSGAATGTNVVANSAGTYTIVGNNSFGCTDTQTISLVAFATPIVSIIKTPTTSASYYCSNQTVTLTATGANNYSWSNGSALNTLTLNTTNTFTLTGNSNGCINTKTISLTFNTTPTLTGVSNYSIGACATNSINLTASGANTYSWSTGVTGSQLPVKPTSNTSYTVIGFDGGYTGCNASKVYSVNVINPPTDYAVTDVFGSPITNTICAGNNVNVYLFQNGNYPIASWDNGDYNSQALYFNVQPNQTHTVSVTDATSECTTTLTFNLPIVNCGGTNFLSVQSSTNSLCAGQSATLTASGATTYTWNGVSGSATYIISPTVTTTYTLTGKNSLGATETITITQVVTTCSTNVTVDEIELTNLMSIYPNPANDFITVSLIAGYAQESIVYIINALGEIVLTNKTTSSSATLKTESLTNGIYFIKVESKNGSAIKKFIKQ